MSSHARFYPASPGGRGGGEARRQDASGFGAALGGLGECSAGLARRLANGNTAFVDRSSFIGDLRKLALDLGIGREGAAADLTNVAGRARLGLIYDMQTRGAYGFARWKNDQDPDALDAFPAWEFKRIYQRRIPRLDWAERWDEAFGDDEGATDSASGRMIALKTSPGWEELSAFGTPWPPFDYGSGMGLRDISRKTCLAIGILDPGEHPAPIDADFDDHLAASVQGLSEAFVRALQHIFKDQIEISDGQAHWVKPAAAANSLSMGAANSFQGHAVRKGQRGMPAVSGAEFGTAQGTRLRNLALEFGVKKFSGKLFHIPAIGKPIGITRDNLEHGLHFYPSDDKAKLVPILPKLIRQGAVTEQADRHGRPDVLKYYHLKGVATLSEKTVKVRVVLRETKNDGVQYYWHRVDK